MRTIMSFASPPLPLQMPPAATLDGHEHLPPPLNPHDPSRTASPRQPDLSLLVSGHNPQLHSADHAVYHVSDPNERAASTIHSLLTAPAKLPPHNGPPAWSTSMAPSAEDNAPSSSSAVSQRTSSKRKLDVPEGEDPSAKIRRVVHEHVTQDRARIMPMTTVLCLHAAVAQKSYGTEKRFLCPPPVVHIEGPVWEMKHQQLSMAVVHDGGERGFEQKAPLDSNLTASFKFLHVGGTAKAKSFQLTLDISEPLAPAPDGTEQGRGRVWASFESAPVTIISKPSKKTAKTRNISSCILAGGPVSLFNRINSQTVRTKYMTIDHTQLCASNVAWSAFNVNVLKTTAEEPPPIAGPQPVTYGSEILLVETGTGIQSPPLTIRKVDKGRIVMDDNGPVSQMQKVALERKEPDGSRHYLSAAGPLPGTPGAVVAPPLTNGGGATHPLVYQAARVREEFKDGQNRVYDEVDDYLCWTIVGISKFQYTFFDAFGQDSRIPDIPITPFPTLFTTPHYRMQSNTLELTTANFFYEDPRSKRPQPLDIYVGNLGPLRFRVFPSANNQLLTNVNEPWLHHPGTPAEPPYDRMASPHSRYVPMAPSYITIVVEMPPMQEILKALLEDALPPSTRDVHSQSSGSGEGGSSSSAKVDTSSIAGRSLPLLFIRTYDGVGYHSGRAIQAENIFHNADHREGSTVDSAWLAAATNAANTALTVDGGLHGWALRVI